jgi:predicted GIY-YIG superfamily endonuclease
MIYSIYQIKNETTGKSYVGFTRNLRKRLSDHRARRPVIFEGGRFTVDVIDEAANREEAGFKERYWISRLGTNKNGYNLRNGGDAGADHHEKTREAARQRNLGKKHSEVTKQKMRDSHKGRVLTAEHRSNISKGRTGCSSRHNPAARTDWPEVQERLRVARVAAAKQRRIDKGLPEIPLPKRAYTVTAAVLAARPEAIRKGQETRRRKARQKLTNSFDSP